LFLHAVVGFGLFLCFTAELVGSAAKPPTAFSTIQGTFPLKSLSFSRVAEKPFEYVQVSSGFPSKLLSYSDLLT
jgi:hypothetical protein